MTTEQLQAFLAGGAPPLPGLILQHNVHVHPEAVIEAERITDYGHAWWVVTFTADGNNVTLYFHDDSAQLTRLRDTISAALDG